MVRNLYIVLLSFWYRLLNFNRLSIDDRPVDEERKSVRFDIEKELDIRFTYSRSEDHSESESEEQEAQMLAMFSNRDTDWIPSSQKTNCQRFNEETKGDSEDKIRQSIRKSSSLEKIKGSKKNGKVVGKRFVVRNVSENEHRKRFIPQNVSDKEHRMQMTRDSLSGESLSRESSLDYTYTNKFNKIKNRNIDLVSKSETTDYSDSEARRKYKSKVDFSRNEQTDDDDTSDFPKLYRDAGGKQEQDKNLEETKIRLSQEHEKDIEALQKEYKDKLEQTKKELEENFMAQKKQLEKNMTDKLEESRRKMVEKVFCNYFRSLLLF